MSVLRGNYQIPAILKPKKDETAQARFEDAALKRLGGSIAFVAKKRVVWVKPA